MSDVAFPLLAELQAGFLHFAIRQQPNQRFIVKIDNLNAVAPGIVKVATKRRLEFQFVFSSQFLPDFFDLFFVAHHDSEMAHVGWLNFFYFKNCEELVLAEFEEGIAFSAVELLQIENVLIKRDRLFDVINLDRDMITSVNLHAHFPIYILPGKTKAGGTRSVVSVKRGRPHFANVLTKIACSARNLFCWAFVGNY